MSTSVSPSAQSGKSVAKQNRAVKGWVTVTATILLCLVVGFVIRTQGYISGYEFAPSHFEQREFSFYEIPLIHLQITPVKRKDTTPAAATYVRMTTLKNVPRGPATTWHLVSISRGLTGQTVSDANLLLQQLLMDDPNSSYWQTWSKQHPGNSAILWPIIQQLAQRELYVLIPMVFQIAEANSDSSTQMQKILDKRLAEEYVTLIKDMREAKNGDIAAELLAEALIDYPSDPELKRLAQGND